MAQAATQQGSTAGQDVVDASTLEIAGKWTGWKGEANFTLPLPSSVSGRCQAVHIRAGTLAITECVRRQGHTGNHLNADDEEWSDAPKVRTAPDGEPVPISKTCNWCDQPALPSSILCASCQAQMREVEGWPNNPDAPVTPGAELR